MAQYALPALCAVFLWWFTTGVIIFLDNLHPRTFKWSMAGWTVILVAALAGLAIAARDASVGGVLLAFTCALLVWGWQEISFYLGYVTGPVKTAPPRVLVGWPRFVEGVRTTLHHEYAILATLVVVVAVSWGQPNQFGLWTFVLMWWMHESARVNVFLGVLNLNEEFFPPHMAYLRHYLRKRPMNLFFPVSVTVSTTVATLLVMQAAAAETAFQAAGWTILATMMILAVLEHWFLVLPLPAAALWRWSITSRLQEDDDVAP